MRQTRALSNCGTAKTLKAAISRQLSALSVRIAARRHRQDEAES
jgi:hypothetical protein